MKFIVNFKELLHETRYELLLKGYMPSRFIDEEKYQLLFVHIIILDNKELALRAQSFMMTHDEVYEFSPKG